MGSYTPNQKLWKPDETDLVDVERDIEYNWNRLDDRTKKIFEWTASDEPVLTGNVPMENNFKYLKRETNSKWVSWFDPSTQQQVLKQDATQFVPGWVLITPSAGWVNGTTTTRLMVQFTGPATAGGENLISYRGIIRRNPAAELQIKTDTTVATGISALYRPAVDREVVFMGGDATAGMVASGMLRFTATGEIHFFKYGTAQGGLSGEWIIPFNSVSFPRGD